MLTIAILGLGDRGMNYGNLSRQCPEAKIVAVCDKDPQRVSLALERFGLDREQGYGDSQAFFAAGKLADVVFVCTQDRDHYGHTMEALKLGYHVMVEKPVSPNPEHLKEIRDLARQQNRKVVVCHVLRYSRFYQKIRELLQSGVIGRTVLIRHSENVAYWHYIHSYVRGHWHREEETSPMLLAKCCHDMDLLYWWVGSPFASIYSQGGLTFYTPASAPEGAAKACFQCPHRDTCIYDARLQYLGRADHPAPRFPWGTYAVSNQPDEAAITAALQSNSYGRCVFAGGNNVVDYQTAEIRFENGVVAQFSVNGFSNENYRKTHIFGTQGEIYCNDLEETITLHVFGQEKQVFDFSDPNSTGYGGGHVGGDLGLVQDVVALFTGKEVRQQQLTLIDETLESHQMVDACERSRKTGQVILRDK